MHQRFRQRFGGEPVVARAPGRVNLIGEHTDYNEGFVMPVAIGFSTCVAAALRGDGRWRAHSANMDETVDLAINADSPAPLRPPGVHWSDYVAGVVRALREDGLGLGGADLLIEGDVPMGAGLSSSASLEVATALALTVAAGAAPAPWPMARLCQRAENEHVGMRCGIMDQFAAVFGRRGQALRLDCRSLEHVEVPLQSGTASACLVVCNTMVRHRHAGGEYNLRRAQCERAVAAIRARDPQVRSLRDIDFDRLRDLRRFLDPVLWRRVRHIVSENERVLAATTALQRGDHPVLGSLLRESHESMRVDYEISCPELDAMVRIASGLEGVHGARMTGGGFGGCTINLVRADALERFVATVPAAYQRETGVAPALYACESADGAAILPESRARAGERVA